MTSTPVDMKLYNRIKYHIYELYPTHSAYRSGLLVKKYKEEFAKKYGNKKPYRGKKSSKKGLTRWFAEKWTNQRGEIGYQKSGDIYRPNRRITKKSPTTWKELTKNQIKEAQKEKKKTGRVKKFSK